MNPTSNQPKKLLDMAQMMLRGDIPLPPAARLIGSGLTSIEPSQAVFEFEASRDKKEWSRLSSLLYITG